MIDGRWMAAGAERGAAGVDSLGVDGSGAGGWREYGGNREEQVPSLLVLFRKMADSDYCKAEFQNFKRVKEGPGGGEGEGGEGGR